MESQADELAGMVEAEAIDRALEIICGSEECCPSCRAVLAYRVGAMGDRKSVV